MSVLKWIELKCDECGDISSGLRFQEDMNSRSLRDEAKDGGWVVIRAHGGLIDLCNKCKPSKFGKD